MASKNYEYIFTESAEADIDLTFSYISDTLNNPDAESDLADELHSLKKSANARRQERLLKTSF